MLEKEANQLLEKYHVPENIKAHCRKVAFLAEKIARRYNDKGVSVNINLVKTSAILHDLFRIIDIKGEGYLDLCKKASQESIELWEELKKEYKGLFHCQAAANFLRIRGKWKWLI